MRGNLEKIVELRTMAERGDESALTELGSAYLLGTLGIEDQAEGFRLLEQAAEQGGLDAVRLLAETLEQKGDRVGAIRWLDQAAKAGCTQSALHLANTLVGLIEEGEFHGDIARKHAHSAEALYVTHLNNAGDVSQLHFSTSSANFGWLLVRGWLGNDRHEEGEKWLNLANATEPSAKIMNYFARKEKSWKRRSEIYLEVARLQDFPEEPDLSHINEAKACLGAIAFSMPKHVRQDVPYLYFLKEAGISGSVEAAALAAYMLSPSKFQSVPPFVCGKMGPNWHDAYAWASLARVLNGGGYLSWPSFWPRVPNISVEDLQMDAAQSLAADPILPRVQQVVREFLESNLQNEECKNMIFECDYEV